MLNKTKINNAIIHSISNPDFVEIIDLWNNTKSIYKVCNKVFIPVNEYTLLNFKLIKNNFFSSRKIIDGNNVIILYKL